MRTSNDHATTLGALAAQRPASMAVFERLGLDYCCGGGRTLSEACRAAGLEPGAVLEAIAAEEGAGVAFGERDWTGATMTELADHIEATHHAFVRDALTRLDSVMPRVLAAHGASDPRLHELSEVFARFAAEMRDHMIREERVLFPWLRRLDRRTELNVGPPWSVQRPISCMVHDHDDAGRELAEMRALTDGFTPPAGACATYCSMLALLAGLERDTHVHIHKENAILFPAGIRAEEERLGKPPAPDGGGR